MLGVPGRLHDYQWEGVAFLYRSPAALLADEMGLGKTVEASVALALLLNARNDLRRALIVAPAALTSNWMSELAVWAPSLTIRRLHGNTRDREAFYLLPIPVLVSSYEQIRQDGLDRIPSNTFDVVILGRSAADQEPRFRDSTGMSAPSEEVLLGIVGDAAGERRQRRRIYPGVSGSLAADKADWLAPVSAAQDNDAAPEESRGSERIAPGHPPRVEA